MELFPAIDVRNGNCVRLQQGDYGRETIYGDDPVAVATSFIEAGATWIHVVDLDAARTGEPVNRDVVGRIAAVARSRGVRLQTGGGVRSAAAAKVLFDLGVHRVVVGTAAVERPAVVGEIVALGMGEVAVGLDARLDSKGTYEVAVHGWTAGSGRDLFAVLDELSDAGAHAVVATEIGRDGMLTGPDMNLYRLLLDRTQMAVVASGGVSSLDDLRALHLLASGSGRELQGAIAGRAIYEAAFTVSDGVRVCRTGVC